MFFTKENSGIQFETVEWEEEVSGFFKKRKEHKQTFYVNFYSEFDKDGLSETKVDYDMASERLQQRAQYIWKDLINKLKQFNKDQWTPRV